MFCEPVEYEDGLQVEDWIRTTAAEILGAALVRVDFDDRGSTMLIEVRHLDSTVRFEAPVKEMRHPHVLRARCRAIATELHAAR